MQTIQLEVDDFVIERMGKERIKNYLEKLIRMERLEAYTKRFSDSIDLTDEEYENSLEEIRKESWEEYKKDIPFLHLN